MSDTQLLTLALSIIIPLSMLIYSNSRIEALEKAITKSMGEMKETLRAEMKTLSAELTGELKVVGGKVDALAGKIDSQMKQHVLELHK